MLARPQRKHGPKAEMNVVPYIDVMLVLLVIFMVTAPMLTQGVKIELPKVASEALVNDSQVLSGIDQVEVDTNVGNHSIQGEQPRTAIGVIDENHFVFVVVDGRETGYSRGVTMTELAEIMQGLGATEAYNLDGGGSSELWFNGEVVNQPSNGGERATSDILYIG